MFSAIVLCSARCSCTCRLCSSCARYSAYDEYYPFSSHVTRYVRFVGQSTPRHAYCTTPQCCIQRIVIATVVLFVCILTDSTIFPVLLLLKVTQVRPITSFLTIHAIVTCPAEDAFSATGTKLIREQNTSHLHQQTTKQLNSLPKRPLVDGTCEC